MWQRYGLHIYGPDEQKAHAPEREQEEDRSEAPCATYTLASLEERRAAFDAAREAHRTGAPSIEERRAAFEAAREVHRSGPAGIEERRAAFEAARVPTTDPQPDRGRQTGEWDLDRDR